MEYKVTVKDENGITLQYTIDEEVYNVIKNKGKANRKTIGAYLRASLGDWKEASSAFNDDACVITKYKPYDLHHPTPYEELKKITFERTGITVRKYSDEYTKEELKELVKVISDVHYEHGLGIPLCRRSHQEFHAEFGKYRYTKEQTLEFVRRFNPDFEEFDYLALTKAFNEGTHFEHKSLNPKKYTSSISFGEDISF